MKARVTIHEEGARFSTVVFEGASRYVVHLEGLPGGIDCVWSHGQNAQFECSATGSHLSLKLDGDAFIITRDAGRYDYYLANDGSWKEPVYADGHRTKPDALRIPVTLLTDPPE